jgi:hypothetical protein
MLDDAKKFRRASKTDGESANSGHSNASNNNSQQRNAAPNAGSWRAQNGGGSNNGMNWSGAKSPALSAVSSRMGGSDDGSMAGLSAVGGFGMGMPGMAAMGSPGLGMGMPGMANLAAAGMNPFMLNMAGMANMGITPEAQLLAAQMAASGFNPAGLSPFGNLAALQAQQIAAGQLGRGGGGGGMGGANNTGRTRNAMNQKAGGAKKDEEDVDPRVLEDIPAWLRSLRLHKYTPNFEGMNWRDMVMMDEAALEAKGVAALGARRKMLKTFEIVRNKMGIPHPEGTTTGEDSS